MTQEIRTLRVKCGGCGFPWNVAAAPTSPMMAKARCPRCEYVTTVQTRTSGFDFLDELNEKGKDRQAVTARARVWSKASTKLGPAFLIEK